MLGISVIILSFNESIHIKRCIENVQKISSDIFVVDSFSQDDTVEIASRCGATVIQNKWPGNQAAQFNWALEHLKIKTDWILRLDADEYLYPGLIDEIKKKLNFLPLETTGVVFKRRHIFLGKWIRRGTYPVQMLRLFRYKKAICEERWMDEHIQLLEGQTIVFEQDFADHNLNNISWWVQKHNGYAIREAIDILNNELGLIQPLPTQISYKLSDQAADKRNKKLKYSKQPIFWRSFAYFIYRYIFKLGFLEGKEGFLWHFLQGWWYRTLVDAQIFEIKMACGKDHLKIKTYILKNYNIKL